MKEVQEGLSNVIILHAKSETEAVKMIKNSVRSIVITSSEIGSIFIPSLFCGI